ncbi:hypothetical protein M9H77_05961 [Catharanthus roseus]|uniref:Uncharacterized protein n=1 Tax=Catharanthus roseus TaxID=4058 RepID=A0ACC0BQZ7_CATRO|nr:hypothetical protein M9H77_05961 [Catharanthus roseus]
MNPLTLVKRIQNINAKEAALGISDEASWHAKYKDSAYVYVGGISFDLTEGDLLAVFAQYGEIVDVNLVRDKGTGKSKGFAFLAYEDQRSTNLAVDNLNGATILGRIIRVDHVSKYKKKEEEDEETMQRKREERGVCRAFQKGECTRGAGCKFSHDEQRAANTGWGHEEDRRSRWTHDRFDGPTRNPRQSGGSTRVPESSSHDESRKNYDKQLDRKDKDTRHLDESHDRRSKRHDESNYREDRDRRDEKRSRRNESEHYHRDDRDSKSKDKKPARDRDSPPKSRRTYDEDNRHRSHR